MPTDWSGCEIVEVVPGKVRGVPLIRGTRTPATQVIESLDLGRRSSMKILFDQNAPRPLASFLTGHAVVRSASLGWAEMKNGQLIMAAEAENFDLMITADDSCSWWNGARGAGAKVSKYDAGVYE